MANADENIADTRKIGDVVLKDGAGDHFYPKVSIEDKLKANTVFSTFNDTV